MHGSLIKENHGIRAVKMYNAICTFIHSLCFRVPDQDMWLVECLS